ncbi:hypothetical protein BGZ46_001415 [Entomortierella lignicola]|nr:hypothetical protein BGZ46_001415 [Entomortierella lignicola]
MANSCNNHNSTSTYPPFCCVHNGSENQPLLGHHTHQGDYRVDLSNEKSTAASAPYSETCSSSSWKSRRSKFWARFLGFVFLGYVCYSIFHPDRHGHGHSHDVGYGMDNDSQQSNDSTIITTLCGKDTIEWDGPSIFQTNAENFNLRFGKGNINSQVEVYRGPVTQPTLRLSGRISPLEIKSAVKNTNGVSTIEIEHLGLHIIIQETSDLFDVFIWYETRSVEGRGWKYSTCANLDLSIILPESYTSYNSISIDGGVASVHAYDLDTISFKKLDFATNVGKVIADRDIFVDEFVTKIKTGKAEIESIQVSKESEKPLNVKVASSTGHIVLGVKTTPVNENEEKHHSIDVSTNTGSIKVDVISGFPDGSSKKPGHVDISTVSRTGSVNTNVELAPVDQRLYLNSSTNTGSVRASVSDSFLGHFKLETRTGAAVVSEAPNSESYISYEKQTRQIKAGVKALRGGDDREYQSQIDLQTKTGRASIEFTA